MPRKDRTENGTTSSKGSRDFEKRAKGVSVEGTMSLEAHLQQPVEDSTVMKDLVALRSHIEAHTMTFYNTEEVTVDRAELEKCLEDVVLTKTTEKAAELTSILLEPMLRAEAIRSVIAQILFASIDFFGDAQQTLLPPTAVGLMSTWKLSERSDDESRECEADATISDED